jgi:hypothetical protein
VPGAIVPEPAVSDYELAVSARIANKTYVGGRYPASRALDEVLPS